MKISRKNDVRSLKSQMRFRNNIQAWILMLPMVAVLYLFVWRPTVMGAFWSFFKMKGYTPGDFVGVDNYIKVISHTQFLSVIWNTLQYVFWSIVIGFLPPIFIAIMLNELVHFRSGMRVLIYLPAVIPGIAAMLMWYYIYYPDQTGLLNNFLSILHIDPYIWLNDPDFTILGLIIYSTWKGMPGTILLYFACVQSVSVELYEASIIDGAGPFKRVWYVTRPAMDGIILLTLVRTIIGVFQTMELPLGMTGGGPNGASATISFQLYQYGFNSGGKSTGQAMALGVIIFLILIVFTCFYFAINRKIEDR